MPDGSELIESGRFGPWVSEFTERVEWFIVLRWLAVAGILLAVPAGKYVLGFRDIPAGKLLVLAAILFLLNCSYVLASRAIRKRTRVRGKPDPMAVGVLASIQIVLDLLILTAILHFSGGIHNRFSCYYVFHVVIASILLTRRSAYAVAALCVALYSTMILMEYSRAAKFYPLAGESAVSGPGYIVMSIAALSSTLFIAAYMATSIMVKLRQKEGELENALTEVRELEATKSRFLMLVSHELRSPIVAVQSILDALQVTSKECLEARGTRMLERAGERTEGLLTLTKDLLTLSQQQTAGRKPEHVGKADMLDITRKGLQLHRVRADARGVRLIEEYPDTAFYVSGDPDTLSLIIANLVSNAVRYTPPDGEVRVSWKLEPPVAILTVADTGIGIPESELPSIFREFFRAQNAKSFTASGTGLGLSITKNIVENAGGTISVESKEGRGTAFTVVLPVADA